MSSALPHDLFHRSAKYEPNPERIAGLRGVESFVGGGIDFVSDEGKIPRMPWNSSARIVGTTLKSISDELENRSASNEFEFSSDIITSAER